MLKKTGPTPKASSASALLHTVDYYARFGISIRRLLTDNGPGNRPASFRPFVTGSASANLSLGPSTPRAQSQAEPLVQTLLREMTLKSGFTLAPNEWSGTMFRNSLLSHHRSRDQGTSPTTTFWQPQK